MSVAPGQIIEIVGCHAEGEVGDVIVGGVEPPPGDSVWAQARWIERDRTLRDFVLNEPRGGVFRHVNLLVPPKNPAADVGWIIMEPEDTPPMSGSNCICVATVLLETGRIAMREPETRFALEAPAGLVPVRARCRGGKAESVTLLNVPSFADRIGVELKVPGVGALRVDTAYGGDTFVIVDAAQLGFEIAPAEARDLCETGIAITRAANEQLGFRHPENPAIKGLSFCQFTRPLATTAATQAAKKANSATVKSAVVVRPGKIDRSPTGTGLSALLAVLRAKGALASGASLTGRSIIGSEFTARIEEELRLGGKSAIRASVTGRGWITGRRQLLLDPGDPWPAGYRLSDTWPDLGSDIGSEIRAPGHSDNI